MNKTITMTLFALALMVSRDGLSVPVGINSDSPAVEGVLKLNPITSQSFVAAWLPVPEGACMSGIRWFNNDEHAAFLEVLELHGSEDGLTAVGNCTLVAEDVGGTSSGWSELTFGTPITCGGDGAFLVFHVPPNNAAVSDGAGGGAGIGYVDGSGAKCWVTVDGVNWVAIDQAFGLAIEPVLVAADASSASKYGGGATARDEPGAEVPKFDTALQSIAPNPFNPDTEIKFTLRETTRLSVSVFDIGGRRVANLVDGTLAQGVHAVRWDGSDGSGRSAASGVYLVRMVADGKAYSQRMLLVK